MNDEYGGSVMEQEQPDDFEQVHETAGEAEYGYAEAEEYVEYGEEAEEAEEFAEYAEEAEEYGEYGEEAQEYAAYGEEGNWQETGEQDEELFGEEAEEQDEEFFGEETGESVPMPEDVGVPDLKPKPKAMPKSLGPTAPAMAPPAHLLQKAAELNKAYKRLKLP